MTAPASDPDGTDPRILSPSDDEPTVTIARGHSTGKTYHTTECPVVRRMATPNEVSLSVAEWKGYSKCERCKETEGTDSYPHPGRSQRVTESDSPHQFSRGRCLQIRCLLLGGESHRSLASMLGIGGTSVGRHASGDCSCGHYGRALSHDRDTGYTPVGDGVPTDITGRTQLGAETCGDIRVTLPREGVTTRLLATVFGVSSKSVRRHANGKCSHDTSTPPLAWDDADGVWVSAGVSSPGETRDHTAEAADD